MPRSLIRRPGAGSLSAALAAAAVVVITALGLVPSSPAAAAPLPAPVPAAAVPLRVPAAASGGPVVLIGTGGLRWEDVDSGTPALSAALVRYSAGALAVRSVRDSTCPVDGWLAVSAGRRAADAVQPGDRCRVPAAQVAAPGGAGTADGWETFREEAARGRFDADPGLLGSTLEAAGVSRAAVGAGALVATADRRGRTPLAWPGVPAGPDGTVDPGGDALGLADQVRAALSAGARFVAVDVGTVRDTGQDTGTTGEGPATRREQVEGLDTRIGLVIDAVGPAATVLVASLADSGPRPHLQVVLASGPRTPGGGDAFGPGLLWASSTRQDGLVQSTDLLPTVLTALGVPTPGGTVGSRLVRAGGTADDESGRLRALLDHDQAALAVERVVTPFFVAYGVIELLVLGGLALLARRARTLPAIRRRALVGLQVAAVTFSLVPVATFLANLIPWWRVPPVGLPLTSAVIVATGPLAVAAFAGPWRRRLLGPAGAAGALTAGVLTLDLATGSRLELAALIGGQPIIAGRFYGLSNPTFALFATGALLGALALAETMTARGRSRREAALAVAAVGAVATFVDGAPALGSDFGGPPALVPAFGLLALWVAGVRVTWGRLLTLGAATVGVLTALSVADWLRPADERSHLGRFVQSVLDGDGFLIVQRKAEQNWDILVSTPLTMTVPVATVVIVALLRRPERFGVTALRLAYDRQPLLPAGLGALGVILLLGFLANDSGTSIPPASLMLFAPLLIAVCARAVQLDDAERLAADLRAVSSRR